MSIELARTVADTVLWEGYLLYPYRASSSKNMIRWQFGVLGPPQATDSGIAEDPSMHCECLLNGTSETSVLIQLRFLQLVRRQMQQGVGDEFTDTSELAGPEGQLLSFDEAVQRELTFGPFPLSELMTGHSEALVVDAGQEADPVSVASGGRTVRSRRALSGTLTVHAEALSGTRISPGISAPGVFRLGCTVRNDHPDPVGDRDAAIAVSFLGAHLLLQSYDGSFVSLLEPPAELEIAAKSCRQSRCWPVLAGSPGDTDVVLASPIILYDYPAVAPESAGALFDSTEIDEILTLRVMTLTDEEKAAARATDPAAAAIIDRCETMPEETLALMHGVLRDPHRVDPTAESQAADSAADPAAGPAAAGPDARETPMPWDDGAIPSYATPEAPWWDPGVDASVSPSTDTVVIDGVTVGNGSMVRLRPQRRADAQDLFFAGQEAKVTSVFSDVDGNTHIAVVLVDDPASDLHEWYGRYLYFGPEEIDPRNASAAPTARQPPV
ncbi:MAG: hypothetical protein M3Y77_06650 [Actinomycetota bacterium]|nr:hypothetical protein [Actinomycetota bacterium]